VRFRLVGFGSLVGLVVALGGGHAGGHGLSEVLGLEEGGVEDFCG